ncbi:MAG: TniQ family protein, partial [Pyrinomonadaceae bacterium]
LLCKSRLSLQVYFADLAFDEASMKLWPVHLKPMSGEILSSWLIRLSTVHGLTPFRFVSAIGTTPQNLWLRRDIDRVDNQAFFELLAEKTCTSFTTVLSTTLTEYQGKVFESSLPSGVTPWLIPRDNVHIRNSKYFSVQYCPSCLSQDKEPYFRRQWRLAFAIFCVKHKTPLLDRCTKCGQAINFYLNTSKEQVNRSLSLIICYRCNFDLRKATVKAVISPDTAMLKFQKHLLESAGQEWIEIPHIGQIPSLLYFEGLRHLAYALVGSHKYTNNLLKTALQYYGIQNESTWLPRKSTFETLGITTRRVAIIIMQKLLNNWPDEFINFSRTINVQSDAWNRKHSIIETPFWYWKVIHLNLRRTRYIPSEQEITSIFNHLRKTGREVTRKELCKYLSHNVVPHILRRKGLTNAALYASYPESIKRIGIRLVLAGHRYKDITEKISVSDFTLRKWAKAYRESL